MLLIIMLKYVRHASLKLARKLVMNFPNRSILLAAAALSYCSLSAGQEHAAAPMLNSAPTAISGQSHQPAHPGFKGSYARAGRPKIALFWNRQFSDQLSEWQANYRSAVDSEAGLAWQNGDKTENGGSATVNASATAAVQSRRYDSTRGSRPSSEFGFSSAFSRYLLANSVRIVDRQSIVRLADRKATSPLSGRSTNNDFQKIETDSLLGFADYLAEIIFVSDNDAPLKKSFQVTVKSVQTGELIAMFETNGKPASHGPARKQYRATSRGFEVVKNETSLKPEQAGKQVATELLQALDRYWQ